MLRLHPFEQASAWLAASGIKLGDPEPKLPNSPDSETKVTQRLGGVAPGFVAIGMAEP